MHLDLNLLVALDALLDECSVGAAADRLHLTQPAMSHALGRIRRATNNQMLIRSGRAMLPMPYAEQIRDEVHQLVTRAQAVLTPTGEVDPATLRRQSTDESSERGCGRAGKPSPRARRDHSVTKRIDRSLLTTRC